VAIAVVLAAVMWILVVEATGPARAPVPLGTALAVGPSTGVVGSSSINSFCQTGHYCYSIPIQVAQGVTVGDVDLRVVLATGADRVVSQNYAKISVVSDRNAVLAYTLLSKNSVLGVQGWPHYLSGASASTELNPTVSLWVQFGSTKSTPFGQGLTLEIVGVGPFSGDVTVPLP
jgi:hypothetical protein